ncbi:MAG: DMT family transporter [Firmicutes bacterium]|jgi:transporter family-2 protein|nr:DMT family transporter [Bacillota bacterium]
MSIVSLALAALSGVFMAIQGSLNTALSKIIGLLEATFLVHIIGALVGLVLLVFGLGQGNWDQMNRAPWYSYLGGILGLGIVYLVATAIAKVGAAPATTAIILGQVSTAALVDHFGWFGLQPIGFNIWKGVGIVLMAVGAWLLLYRNC